MTEQEMNRLSEKLDEIEARIDNMNRTLDELIEEIDKGISRKTLMYDGEIMTRYKHKNNDSDESMYDINRSI